MCSHNYSPRCCDSLSEGGTWQKDNTTRGRNDGVDGDVIRTVRPDIYR